ncbi:unnamed protein product [Ambrosiozyma monospora]|uniref:Unnamed protein product n=1 Tax=Ambrosiozyma monospora TaxID=43982 RepID=A0ACB5TCL5_AMBMO|nr:unnamed protein product [Ambrosiozyma monospora]
MSGYFMQAGSASQHPVLTEKQNQHPQQFDPSYYSQMDTPQQQYNNINGFNNIQGQPAINQMNFFPEKATPPHPISKSTSSPLSSQPSVSDYSNSWFVPSSSMTSPDVDMSGNITTSSTAAGVGSGAVLPNDNVINVSGNGNGNGSAMRSGNTDLSETISFATDSNNNTTGDVLLDDQDLNVDIDLDAMDTEDHMGIKDELTLDDVLNVGPSLTGDVSLPSIGDGGAAAINETGDEYLGQFLKMEMVENQDHHHQQPQQHVSMPQGQFSGQANIEFDIVPPSNPVSRVQGQTQPQHQQLEFIHESLSDGSVTTLEETNSNTGRSLTDGFQQQAQQNHQSADGIVRSSMQRNVSNPMIRSQQPQRETVERKRSFIKQEQQQVPPQSQYYLQQQQSGEQHQQQFANSLSSSPSSSRCSTQQYQHVVRKSLSTTQMAAAAAAAALSNPSSNQQRNKSKAIDLSVAAASASTLAARVPRNSNNSYNNPIVKYSTPAAAARMGGNNNNSTSAGSGKGKANVNPKGPVVMGTHHLSSVGGGRSGRDRARVRARTLSLNSNGSISKISKASNGASNASSANGSANNSFSSTSSAGSPLSATASTPAGRSTGGIRAGSKSGGVRVVRSSENFICF